MEAESRKLISRCSEVGEMERHWSKGIELQLGKINKSRELMKRMMTIVNNTALNIGIWIRQ